MKSRKLTKEGGAVKCNAAPKVESNLVKKVTLEILNKRHNALARYIGIPCVVEADKILKGAVMASGSINDAKNFASYRVDLTPFKDEFNKVRFRAASNGKDVAFAMVVSNDDSLEFIAEAGDAGEGEVVLPLTPKSKTLYVTMPAKNGKPLWKNPKVELLTGGGIISEVNAALNSLLGRIQDLEERFENVFACKQSGVSICVN